MSTTINRRRWLGLGACALTAPFAALGQKQYDVGARDGEIKIGVLLIK